MALVMIDFAAGISGNSFAEKVADQLPGVQLDAQMFSKLDPFELGWRPRQRRVSTLTEALLRWGEGWAGQRYGGVGPGAPLLAGHDCQSQMPPDQFRRALEHIAHLPGYGVVACPGAAALLSSEVGAVLVYLRASLAYRVRLVTVSEGMSEENARLWLQEQDAVSAEVGAPDRLVADVYQLVLDIGRLAPKSAADLIAAYAVAARPRTDSA